MLEKKNSYILTLFLLFLFGNYYSFGQRVDSTYDLSKYQTSRASSLISKYIYNPNLDLYIFSETINDYPINVPLVLTPDEFENFMLSEQIKSYFKEKVSVITGNAENIKELQKNLLPELYVNSKFFQSVFGSSKIDITPKGSVGIDLGVRYQKNDNPAASPRNRSSFGFDFDQRISLSLLGNIGERLQITANYDTESTFDFQNLVKVEFNPPRLEDLNKIIPENSNLSTKIQNTAQKIGDFNSTLQEAKEKIKSLRSSNDPILGVGNNVSDYLNGKVTEDAIIQNINIGNISMPLNSNLIQGAQSLFGVRADLKFGKTTLTGVFSEQRSQSQNLVAQGGGTMQDFNFFALDYEEDRHYFLAHYFRDNYEKFLKTYPYINSPVKITRIEVWITNRGSQTQNIRNIVGFQDLGEANPDRTTMNERIPNFISTSNFLSPPSNEVNLLNPDAIGAEGILNENIRDIAMLEDGLGIYKDKINEGFDYAVLESARKLNSSEYNLNEQLGYISLNQRLSNDEVLAVAFQYSIGGKIFQVGEFANMGVPGTSYELNSDDQQVLKNNSLIVKLLKSNITDVRQPIWDLMMKNIYNTGAFQLAEENFRLNILYSNPSPVNYISPIDDSIWPENLESQILLSTFNLDRLNFYRDPQPEGDGFFDYVPGITIEPRFGRIIFPTIEPFGEYLFKILDNPNSQTENYNNKESYNANQKHYVFEEMYSLTKAAAMEISEKNKFQLKGRYKSEAGDGIPIGAFNVPRGSVKVSAGGRVLTEGIDYTVNYEIGRVKILDPALQASNIPINISVENNSFFNQQNKRFSGINVSHKINEKIVLGGTLLNLSENPLTQKANYGTEPVNNTMIGLNTNFSTEAPFLTRLINKLPTISTDVKSIISFRGEVAKLISGDPRNTQLQGESNVYVDDFEGAQTNIDIKGFSAWNLSSVPYKNFKGSGKSNGDLSSGYGRAKMAWYSIDPIFYTGSRPQGINNNDISLNETRRIFIKEIFPEQDLVQGTTTVQTTFDLAYYPDERGPYNNSISEVFKSDIDENWAGIMRPISATNFEQSNVEFIEFWLLDTFSNNDSENDDLGNLYFHLGNISEDVLKDGRKQYENGLPGINSLNLTHDTSWGKVPATQSLLYAFNTIPEDRVFQDVGFDGLPDEQEKEIYTNGPDNDPANDNYEFFGEAEGSVLDRYKNYNGTDGNSPVEFSNEQRGNTTEPDSEDINRDQSMNTIDSYFEYRVPIRKSMGVGNHPFISDVRENVKVSLPNGDEIITRWIQFKIPVQKSYYEETQFSNYFEAVNSIEDLRSIRFMRLVLGGFSSRVVFRFGTLDLVRGDWRRYNKSLNDNIQKNLNTTVDISTVNILENENRTPINYVLPPDIEREQINNNNTIVRQNEQSLSFRVCDLQPMDYRAVYKNVDFDFRQYKSLKMFMHAESIFGKNPLPGDEIDGDYDNRIVAFIRLGSDFKDNYYQIEIPLKPSSYQEDSSNRLSAEEVWHPESNSIDVSISLLSKLKAKSLNKGVLSEASYFDEEMNFIQEFTSINSLPGAKKYKFSVKGNPSLGSIKTLMIGLKNPSIDFGNDLCGEVWFNELRIAGIERKDGWATISTLDANIADFASISATGRLSTIGFGAIDQSPNQSNREDMKQYDIVSEINLGKIFPENWGLQVPLSMNLGEEFLTPEYDPFYQDILLKDRMDSSERSTQKDSIKDQAMFYTKRKSVNLIGVRKNSSGKSKQRFYSPENFDFSYSYNEVKHNDYEIENQKDLSLQMGANYGYRFKPLEFYLFKDSKLFDNKKYWDWLKEINFNLLPDLIAVTSRISRDFKSQRFRQIYMEGIDTSNQIPLPDLQLRNYLFDWSYNLNHNLTKSLRFTFQASNNNIVKNFLNDQNEEGYQTVDKTLGIWDGIWNTGQTNRHFQSATLNYKIPFNYFPFLNFIDASYSYTGDFSWQRGSDALANVENDNGELLGRVNTIQNANTRVLSGSISFNKLYQILGLSKDQKERKVMGGIKRATTRIVDFLSLLKRIQINYSENNGKVLPGYLQGVGFMGTLDPSFGFTMGSQADIRYESARRGWLTKFPNFNESFEQIHNNKFRLIAQINPVRDLAIDLNMESNYSENLSENFRIENQEYIPLNSNKYGNFGVSTIMIRTSFKNSEGTKNSNFEIFRKNLFFIAKRFSNRNLLYQDQFDQEGYPFGYGKNHQEVLVTSFLSAYTGSNVNRISLDPMKKMPLPNWNVKYSGFTKIKAIKKIFRRASIAHGYRASYTITNFQSNLQYNPFNPFLRDRQGNFLTSKLFSNINLVEQFNPLVRLDLEFNNSLKILGEIKRDRALSLSLDNNLITESNGNEYILGLGYRIKDLRVRSNIGGRRFILNGDLNLKGDFSLRENITVLRNLEYDSNQVTAGQTIMSIKITADYALSKNLTSLFFYDHNFSKFAISTAFPQNSIRSGITIRYNFGN